MQKIYLWVKVLAVVGVLLSLYLLVEQFYKPTFRPCTINSVVNCDAIIDGPVSKTLGLPTPLYGLVGYIVIFFGAMLRKNKLLISMATFGLVFCLSIAYIEIVRLHVLCPVCVLCQLVMISEFVLSVKLLRSQGTV